MYGKHIPFTRWFWEYAWLIPGSTYTIKDLAVIAFETEALLAGVEPGEEFTIVDYVVLPDDDCENCGNLVVHKDRPILH